MPEASLAKSPPPKRPQTVACPDPLSAPYAGTEHASHVFEQPLAPRPEDCRSHIHMFAPPTAPLKRAPCHRFVMWQIYFLPPPDSGLDVHDHSEQLSQTIRSETTWFSRTSGRDRVEETWWTSLAQPVCLRTKQRDDRERHYLRAICIGKVAS